MLTLRHPNVLCAWRGGRTGAATERTLALHVVPPPPAHPLVPLIVHPTHCAPPPPAAFMGLCTAPPCLICEYCPRGSVYDLLQQARSCPSLARHLIWLRRLRMALGAATGMVRWKRGMGMHAAQLAKLA